MPMNLLIVPSVGSLPLLAYLGPGLAAGTIALVLGFIASAFLAIFALAWYPIKRLVRRLKRGPVTRAADES
jgi:hypothetical protein